MISTDFVVVPINIINDPDNLKQDGNRNEILISKKK